MCVFSKMTNVSEHNSTTSEPTQRLSQHNPCTPVVQLIQYILQHPEDVPGFYVCVYTAGNYTHILAAIKRTAIHNPSGESAICALARLALDVELTQSGGGAILEGGGDATHVSNVSNNA